MATPLPTIVHAHDQRALKSEDVIYLSPPGELHTVFLVCDGHGGPDAAQATVDHLPRMLQSELPAALPDFSNRAEVEAYAERLREAISNAAIACDNIWAHVDGHSGSTMTLAVISGWLFTMANCGDSNAILDTGGEVLEITNSHRIQANKEEQQRLKRAGAQLAPLGFHLQGPAKPQEMGVGPLRLWPGGLCVSRSIGDVDSGPLVVPLPHVRQLLLPRTQGLRLIMASDGLWDLMSFTKAAKSCRNKLPHQAVASLVQTVVKDRRMADDVSIIVADMLPDSTTTFPASALRDGGGPRSAAPAKSSSGGGGLFSCFGGGAQPVETEAQATPPLRSATLDFVADVDCLQAYPQFDQQLTTRPAVQQPPGAMQDYTVHGRRAPAHVFDPSSSWHTGGTVHGGAARSAYSTVAPTAAMAAVIPASGSPTRAASADYEHESADLEIATPAALLAASAPAPARLLNEDDLPSAL